MDELQLRHTEFKAFIRWYQNRTSDALVVCHDGAPAFMAVQDVDTGDVAFGWVQNPGDDICFVDFS